MTTQAYLNLAFYQFARIEQPFELRDQLRAYCANQPFRGTLLVSHEGLNGMLSGEEAALRDFQSYLRAMEPFRDISFKESWSAAIAFPRMLVKVKKEIIPLGMPEIDPARRTGDRLLPAQLKAWLDEGKEITLLDTRNDYEMDYGTFKGATRLPLKHFREFPQHLAELPADAKDKPLVMFCTGGIRCEKASVVAMDQGFHEVYQLEGGILQYFKDCGGSHYEGECFVFDRRVAVYPDLSEILPEPQTEA
jgi:UPF0176 protein